MKLRPFDLVPLGTGLLAASELPRLEKCGAATRFVVDGQPWLIRGGHTAESMKCDDEN